MKRSERMKNKKILIIGLLGIIVIIGIIIAVIMKPKTELNTAVNYLKNGEYSKAYGYVNERNNEENKIIVKELITEIFCGRAGKGTEKITDIVTKATNLVYKVDINNIDYTMDDQLNIQVEGLDTYIDLEKEITKDMIAEELGESYDLYFKDLKFTREKLYNYLDRITDQEFQKEVVGMSNDFTKQANGFKSYADNHKFNPKSRDIYEEIQKYIIN